MPDVDERFAVQIYSAPPSKRDKEEFWAEVFEDLTLVPADTIRDRIKVCYRLTRALAHWKGIVTEGQTLAEGTDVEPSPWYTPITMIAGQAPPARAERLIQVQRTPMSLQPPPAGAEGSEVDLRGWLLLMGRLAKRLNLSSTEGGRRGLKWLLEPETVREMWIRPEVLVAWENIMLSEMLEIQLDLGVHEGQVEARKKFELSVMETRILGDLSRIAAPDIAADNLETKKALMELRIDKFMRRAREEQDLRAELQGLKLLSIIQGLNKAEPEDDMKAMIDVVASESSKETKELKE